MELMEEKRLGKIQNVKFGHVGYQEAQLGFSFTLGHEGWGVSDSRAYWDANIIDCSEHSQWTEEDRDKSYAEIMRFISGLMKDAKVDSFEKLKGKPVEVVFENSTLKHWRILTEVI